MKQSIKLNIAKLIYENEILTKEEKIEILKEVKDMTISEILNNLTEEDIESLYEQGISKDEVMAAKDRAQKYAWNASQEKQFAENAAKRKKVLELLAKKKELATRLAKSVH